MAGLLGLDPKVFQDLNILPQLPGQPIPEPGVANVPPGLLNQLIKGAGSFSGPTMAPWFPPGYVQRPQQYVWMPPPRTPR